MKPPSTTRPAPDLVETWQEIVFKTNFQTPITRQFKTSFQTARSSEITVAHTQFCKPSYFHQITIHKKNEKSITWLTRGFIPAAISSQWPYTQIKEQ
jgi:hypothetical protein